jgi:hypothetical protein
MDGAPGNVLILDMLHFVHGLENQLKNDIPPGGVGGEGVVPSGVRTGHIPDSSKYAPQRVNCSQRAEPRPWACQVRKSGLGKPIFVRNSDALEAGETTCVGVFQRIDPERGFFFNPRSPSARDRGHPPMGWLPANSFPNNLI